MLGAFVLQRLLLTVVLGLLTVAASPVVEHLLQAVQLQYSGCTGFVALWHVGSSQTRDQTYVPSTAPPGKSLDSIFLKELNLVSEGKYSSGKQGQ